MSEVRIGNIQINRIDGNQELAIASHGGYTPPQWRIGDTYLRSGSGVVSLPHDIHPEFAIKFYTPHDKVCIGQGANELMMGWGTKQPICEVRTCGDIIVNYSLSYHDLAQAWMFPDSDDKKSPVDLLRIWKGKVHLSDVFDALRTFGVKYTTIHNFACRINKVTYTDEIN
jgi:hypothetical protein